jgi:glutamate-1-semialdehyde 2,1-aminomutase
MYKTEKSKQLFERALKVMVEGGSSPSRGPANYGEYPLFLESGEGSRVFDVDGNSYIDWMMAYGALPLGHAHPEVVGAIREAAEGGTLFAAATEIEVEVAEKILQAVPSAERVRFANTGTEAAMAAIRLARGYTGRSYFIKFEGHYHGWYDDFLVSAHPHALTSLGHPRDPIKIPESSGLNRRSLEDTIVLPWNDLKAVERAIESHPGQIAAIITEGVMANMGVIAPRPGYLECVQELARANDILFVLDETVTGFRISPGGCQQYYGLNPDITIFGKALGAGLPVAAFVGKAEIMEALAWGGVLHYGTQNASRAGMFAAKTSLDILLADEAAAFRHTWKIGELLCDGLRNLFAASKAPAIVQNVGPMLQIMFTTRAEIRDFREFCATVDRPAYQRFALSLFEHGIYMSPSAALHSVVSLAHTEEDVEETLKAVEKVVSNV